MSDMNQFMNQFKSSFRRLLELRETRDIAKTAAKKAEAEYREKEAELYAELEEAGIRGRLEFDFGGDLGVAKFQRRSTTYGRVLDKNIAAQAFKEAGLDDSLLEPKINEGRLNEYVRDVTEAGGELVDGVDMYTRDQISISRK